MGVEIIMRNFGAMRIIGGYVVRSNVIGSQRNLAGACVMATQCGGRNVVANEVELRG